MNINRPRAASGQLALWLVVAGLVALLSTLPAWVPLALLVGGAGLLVALLATRLFRLLGR